MRAMTGRLSSFITAIAITALLLIGAVPSFAADTPQETPQAARENVLPAADIDMTDAPRIHGTSSMIVDLETGTVLYQKRADKIIEPASLTKILNCLVVLETLPLDQEVTVPEGVETEGSVIGLVPGEKLTVEQLIYGMMLESGNDAAEVLGLAAGGTQQKFSEMMNERARQCGALHTDYKNPNGLNENRKTLNFTTARDLSLICREAMRNQTFREVVATAKYTIPETNKSEARKLRNSNVCLWLKKEKTEIKGKEVPFKYEGCNGIKTGMTSDAGYCFIGSARRGESEFLVITLHTEDGEERFNDAIRLWDYAFSKYETVTVLKADEPAGVQRVWGGEKRKVELGLKGDLGVTVNKGTAQDSQFTTEFRLANDRLRAPVEAGQEMGEALVFNDKGRLVGRDKLYALSAVAQGGPFSEIGIADEDLPLAGAIAGGLLLLILIAVISTSVKKRRTRRAQQEKMQNELSKMRTAGVGMTSSELAEVTGEEEPVKPIPQGPARVSDEELLDLFAETAIKPRDSKERQAKAEPQAAEEKPESEPEPPADQPPHHAHLTEEELEELMNSDV